MIKISFKGKTVVFSKKFNNKIINSLGEKKIIVLINPSEIEIDKVLNSEKNKNKLHYLICESPKKIYKNVQKKYTCINAAGGLVINQKNDVLFIFRNDKWDLPKGKVEKKEKIKKAAVREVEEECGIKVRKCKSLLIKTHHTYTTEKGKNILKTNYWYLMEADGNQKMVPQLEEGITKCEWKKSEEIPELLENSYSSIKDVIASYLQD